MKKQKQIELDVDFIGGQGSLTKEEEKQISEFIKARKPKTRRRTSVPSSKKALV